jgi:putative ABC transport system permease protein
MSPPLERTLALAAKSLAERKLQAGLSALGIVFAVVAVVMMLAIAEGAKRELMQQIAQLGTNTLIVRQLPLTPHQMREAVKNHARGLTADDIRVIDGCIDAVSDAAPIRHLRASVRPAPGNRPPLVVSTTAGYARIKNLTLRAGRFLSDEDVARRQRVCVLGGALADRLPGGWQAGRTVIVADQPFTAVGVLAPTGGGPGRHKTLAGIDVNNAVFVPVGTDTGIAGDARTLGVFSEITLQLRPDSPARRYGPMIERLMLDGRRGFKDFEVVVPEALIDKAQEAQRTFNIVLGCIACISLLVGGIGIMNIMIATVSERTREIGIKRAVGASQRAIAREFLAEAALLTLGGGLVGLLAGAVGAGLVAHYAGWPVRITLWSLVLAEVMAVVVGLFSGAYPAWKAAHLDPIEALRGE